MKNPKRLKDSRRTFNVALIIMLSLTLLFGAATIVAQLFSKSRGFTTTAAAETIDLDVKKYISVSAPSLDVKLLPTSGDKITVDYSAAAPLEISETTDGITITEFDSFTLSLFTLRQYSYHLTIYLPEENYKELYISTNVGSVEIADGIEAEFTEISTKSGNVSLLGADSRVAVRTLHGSVNIDYEYFISSAVIENQFGATRLKMPSDAAIELEFNTASGEFTSSMFNKNYNGAAGALRIVRGTSRKSLSVSTVTGNLYIEEKEK